MNANEGRRKKRWIALRVLGRGWLATAGIVLLGLGFMFRSTYRLAIVSGESMLPTLKPGDLLLVDKRAYAHSEPARGDIVVARHAGDVIVKRVVGLPGEEVEVKQGSLYVNGERVKENHSMTPGALDVGEGKLFPGDFATLGDNRALSPATAVHPLLAKPDILGKVVRVLARTRSGASPLTTGGLRSLHNLESGCSGE